VERLPFIDGGLRVIGMDMYVALPEGYNPTRRFLNCNRACQVNHTKMVITRNLQEAMEGADIVVANVFFSMAHDAEKEKRKKDFAAYQINAQAVKAAKPDYVFMHCGPGYPGVEATEEIFEGPNSAYYDEAENRMHTEKAILVLFCS
jgi:ornithine carbamoyltransferase